MWAAYLGGRLLEALALGVSAGLQRDIRGKRACSSVALRDHPEAVGVCASGHMAAVPAEAAVELVEDAVVLIEVAQLHKTDMLLSRIPFL